MLRTRIITALLLAPLTVASIYLAPFELYGLIFAAITAAAAFEWAALVGVHAPGLRLAYVGAYLGLAALVWFDPQLQRLLLWLSALSWVAGLLHVLRFRVDASPGNQGVDWVHAVWGLIVIGGAFAALLTLRSLDQGGHWVMLALALVWLADVGAYFSGKRFGRRKLLPRVSPGKTWEGVLGGMLLTVALISLVLAAWGRFQAIWLLALPLLVAVSVVGDLFESTLKRRAGVKDSGTLLPGHGGMLDRIDAQLPTLPLFALLVTSLGSY